MDGKHLIEKALSARRYAYAPYSNFFVGAALLWRNGTIYTGCNVETSTFTPTSCAERTAFVKALSEGEREFVAIAVVGGRGEEKDTGFCPPCGVCRQFMEEFCGEDFKIFLSDGKEIRVYSLGELLPFSFDKSFVKGKECPNDAGREN